LVKGLLLINIFQVLEAVANLEVFFGRNITEYKHSRYETYKLKIIGQRMKNIYVVSVNFEMPYTITASRKILAPTLNHNREFWWANSLCASRPIRIS
jgi:hypothetical protein